MYTIEEVRLAISQWDETHDDVHLAMLTEYADLLAQREAQEKAVPSCWRYYNVLGELVSEWIDGVPPERHYGYPLGNDITAEITVECAFTHSPAQVVPDAKRLKALEQAMGEYADDTCRAPTWCAINLVNKRADEILRLEKRSD